MQALRGALAARREKEGGLATTSLEFEYMHRKSQCEMLIGGDDISNDDHYPWCVLSRAFQCLFDSCSFPLRADWRKSDSSVDGEPQGNWRRNSNSLRFPPRPATRAPRRACSQASHKTTN